MPDIFVALPHQGAGRVSVEARTRRVQTAHSPARCSIDISDLLKTLNGREQHVALVRMCRTERCMFKLLRQLLSKKRGAIRSNPRSLRFKLTQQVPQPFQRT
jgi:hypothetical protein